MGFMVCRPAEGSLLEFLLTLFEILDHPLNILLVKTPGISDLQPGYLPITSQFVDR
jgi:hypothetical protein